MPVAIFGDSVVLTVCCSFFVVSLWFWMLVALVGDSVADEHGAVARFFERTTLQTLEIALITGDTELKTLRRHANLRPAILASKLDGK